MNKTPKQIYVARPEPFEDKFVIVDKPEEVTMDEDCEERIVLIYELKGAVRVVKSLQQVQSLNELS